MNPLVSILIPAYNAESWIEEAIQSAIGQTWQRKEIIIVDDGSKDGTLSVARRFESPSVKVVSQTNQGASTARNNALKLSQGDYIQWLDADDVLAQDKIAAQLKFLPEVSSKTLFSSAWGRFYYDTKKTAFRADSLWADLSPVQWMIRKMEDNAWMAVQSWLVSRELAMAAGPWNTALTMDDDGEYFCRLVCTSDGIRFIPESRSYVRRANLGSLSNNLHSKSKLESQFRSMTLQIHAVRQLEDSAAVRAACVQYLQTWLIHFYPEHETMVAEASALARELGGELTIPALGWKYDAIKPIFGWETAKKVSFAAPKAKAWCKSQWEKFRHDCCPE